MRMRVRMKPILISQMRYVRPSMSPHVVSTDCRQPFVADSYGREIRSLRLSVTQRCDLACLHCHGEGQSPSTEEMSPWEISRLVRVAASLGIRKVKLTGGEPLLRDDIVDIVSGISPLVKEVSLTTNGSRLSGSASALKRAGLRRVNVSLHTLNAALYERLCGIDLTAKVINGIEAAVSAGLSPVKINMVVFRDENDSEITRMMDFSAHVGAVLQLIEYAADKESSNGGQFKQRFYSLKPFEDILAAQSVETTLNELHRRRRYRIPANGGSAVVEVVRPMHNTEFCSNCTRMRMSSDGKLKPCLLDKSGEIDILGPLRGGASDDDLRGLFLKAVGNRKPYWR